MTTTTNKKPVVKNEFKTRKAAMEYLRDRGWVFKGYSLGDATYRNQAMPEGNRFRIIVQLQTRKWKIQHLQPFGDGAGFTSEIAI